jgi:hypothetical protein
MKRIIALCAALLWLGGANAFAANTAQVGLSEGAYTDLGAAPVSVQALNGNAWVVVADSTPSLAAGGVLLTPMGPNVPITFQQADASSHVYALATSGPATVAYTAIYAASLGSSVSVTNFPATQPVSIASAQIAANAFAVGSGTDGWFTTFGLKADTASATPGGTAMSVWRQIDADINTLNTTAGNPLAAGSNNIGGVELIDSGGTNKLGINSSGQAAIQAPPSLPLPSGAATAANQTLDPCSSAKTNVPISTASGTTALVSGVSAKQIYICSLSLITTTAVSVSLSEGSGATCGTSNQAGVIGVGTNGTAANGLPLAANGGLTLGNGLGTIARTASAADYLCLFQSGTAQIAGNLTYVQQ